jgi:hypothetical protein
MIWLAGDLLEFSSYSLFFWLHANYVRKTVMGLEGVVSKSFLHTPALRKRALMDRQSWQSLPYAA